MRRKRLRIKYRIFKLVLLFVSVASLIGASYSLYSSTLMIGGTVKGQITSGDFVIDAGSDPNLDIDVTLTSSWLEQGLYKYQYSYAIINIGKNTIDNFTITTSFSNNLVGTQVWEYPSSIENQNLIIINNLYQLKKNKSLTIGFIVTSSSPYLKIASIKLVEQTQTTTTTTKNFPVNFAIANSWGNYTYQYDVTVTNKTGNNITYWQLDIALPNGTSYENGWNAIFSTSGNLLTIKNESYNGNLANKSSTTFGLQLNTDISNFIPNTDNIIITVR